MAHTGPKRNAADINALHYLQWHAVDDKRHGRRSLSIIPAAKAESAATAALLECRPIHFITLATGTYDYCLHKRKYLDNLVEQTRHERSEKNIESE